MPADFKIRGIILTLGNFGVFMLNKIKIMDSEKKSILCLALYV
jgi:hypothetical protein